MRLAGIALVWVCCSLWAGVVWAQEAAMTASIPQPRQIGVLDGLPSNRVNGIAEDRQGYLWIATRDGLARFDGVGFRTWRVEDGLLDNLVWSVHVDALDRVWLATSRGALSMLDAERTRFTHYTRDTHPQISVDDIWIVTSTPDDAVWFGTGESGLYRLDPDGTLYSFRHDPADPRSLPSDSVGYFEVDARGRLWVGTRNGVAMWTGRDFDPLAMPDGASRVIDGLTFDAKGDLWIAATGESIVRRADGRIERSEERDPVNGEPLLHMLIEDRQGTRWFDTRSGLARSVGGRIENVLLFSYASRGSLRPYWTSAYQDREGGLWFGSSDSALWYLPANWRNFTRMQRQVSDPASMANAYVRGVAAASDGGFWLVGSGGMLDHLDPATGAVGHRLPRVCGNLVNRSVHESERGGIWIGCFEQLVRFDPRTGQVRRWYYDDAADAAPEGHIDHIVELDDGTLWIAGYHEIQARAPDGRVLASIRWDDVRGPDAALRPTQLMRGPDGALWLTTNAGIYRRGETEAAFEKVPGSPDWSAGAMTLHGRDVIWVAGVGTLAEFRWDGASLVPLRTFDHSDGLPLVMGGGLAVDESGSLWMTTVRGLARIEPDNVRIRLYGARDGLPSQDFSDQKIGVSRDGHFAVGTTEGLLLFHPRDVVTRALMPPLVIETLGVRRDDDDIELPTQGIVELQHGDRDLRVVARLLSFTDAHTHHYRFRLDGYETEWVDADETAERVFPRLEAGQYTLRVEARTEDGDWTALTPLRIDQAPPWWATIWAYTALASFVLLLLLFAAASYRQRLRRKASWHLAEHKRELAEQASLAKSRFLATLGHEVRTPMTGVLGMSELLLNTELDARQRGFAESIRRAGDHLMRLVNDALDLARIEAGRLELDPQPFEPARLVQDVAALCAPMARQKALGFDTVLHEALPGWVLGDAGRVQQILLNLLGNAVKFTESGSVGLQAGIGADRALVFVVSDTGPGLSPEQRERLFRRFEQAEGVRTASRYGGSGLGLAISQELTVAMGGRIELDSTPGEGTRFTVHLPLPVVDAAPSVQQDEAYRQITSAVGLEILLVEDDQTVADVIVGLLESQGHDVVHAAHGLAALSEITTRSFDLAMLDLDLPGIDGLTLAGMMRGHGFAQPMVAVTARADADAEVVARAAGFDGFLRKPLTGEMLSDTLASNWRPSRDDDEPQGGL